MNGPWPLPRTVKPRKQAPDWLPIIAVSMADGVVLVERTGELHPLSDLATLTLTEPSSIVVVEGAARLLRHLDLALGHEPRWQFRVTPVQREVHKADQVKRAPRVIETVVSFWGLRRANGHQRSLWHYPLDPNTFVRRGIHSLITGDDIRVVKLLRWGQDVREFCQAHGLKCSPTMGGIGAQLLRDRRFYRDPRRKVPKATNARARQVLPGNYYKLFCNEHLSYSAVYLDMTMAHHNCAAELQFPDANSLLARGHFHVTDGADVTVPWRGIHDPTFKPILNMHGLFYLLLNIPHLKPTSFPPPFMERPGRRWCWVYSNELPMIYALGGKVEAIEAAWATRHTDPGLNRYAAWAMAQQATMSEQRRQWAKPTLLATYGILAARPKLQEFGYRQATSGIERSYPAGDGELRAIARVGTHEIEMNTANVIHRGMIEAETRRRCLDMARTLHGHGCRVLGIYADSVFVAGDALPLLPAPWSVKTKLSRLQFFNATSFTSAEMTKLPGIPLEGLARLRHLERMRDLARDPVSSRAQDHTG